MSTLRFMVCGGEGEGKSTLVDRLWLGREAVAVDPPSVCAGGVGADVAFRFFAAAERRLGVTSVSGHEGHARHVVMAAASANLAVVVVDASKGAGEQTRQHSRVVALMGIRHVVLAVNMMDKVGFDPSRFADVVADYRHFAHDLGFVDLQAIPLSGLDGDNVCGPSPRMVWHRGPALLQHLCAVDTQGDLLQRPLRLPVQWANPPGPAPNKAFGGVVAAGTLRPGDAVRVLPSGTATLVSQVMVDLAVVPFAGAGDAIAVSLTDEVEVKRGDVLVAAGDPPEMADQFEAKLVWLGEQPLMPGRHYVMKHACGDVDAMVSRIKFRQDVNSGAHLAAKTLGLNEMGWVDLSTLSPVVFEPSAVSRTLGGFLLMDKFTLEPVGAGTIHFALRRAQNIHWQALELNKAQRARQKRQTPRCIWFTGLSGSGKSTLANLLDKRLFAEDRHTYVLDGDNVRHGLNRNLGFTEADRIENIRRVAEVARLMVDAGLMVLVSFISPFVAERAMARGLFAPGEFVEVFVDAPLEECERRDVKGLYAKARRGELKNFTGIDSPYEPPPHPDVHLRTAELSLDQCIDRLMRVLG